jgi:hypothetical protein
LLACDLFRRNERLVPTWDHTTSPWTIRTRHFGFPLLLLIEPEQCGLEALRRPAKSKRRKVGRRLSMAIQEEEEEEEKGMKMQRSVDDSL